MIYKLKRYSKSTILIRKPDIKFRDNNIKKNQYNDLEEPEEDEIIYEEEPQGSSEDYYINNNDDDYSQQIN